METDSTTQIGTLNEKPLHAALKQWYALPEDLLEVGLDGFVIDILRGDLLVEIQTRSFASIKSKLYSLTETRPLRLVYPIAMQKWIVKLPRDKEETQSRRRSPKRGTHLDLFAELVSFPGLLSRPNFSLEVLLIEEEEIRKYDGRKGWRRKGWITAERRLLNVIERRVFEDPMDMAAFVPVELKEPFTTLDLARATGKPRRLAQKMAYCLREMGVITAVGKKRNAILYVRGT
jgi:hypothetical protein